MGGEAPTGDPRFRRAPTPRELLRKVLAPRAYGRLMTSPPAIEAKNGITVSMSTFGEIERTEPSQNAKFSMPPACWLPQARLHWLLRLGPAGDGMLRHESQSPMRVRGSAKVTHDKLYEV